MDLVVADTSPLRYLIVIDEIRLLHLLFARITIPAEVAHELAHRSAPPLVQKWIADPPDWLEVIAGVDLRTAALAHLDPGERAAIEVALAHKANAVLVDDRKGARAAEQFGFEVLGTIGILKRASQLGYISLDVTIGKLQQTNFRYRQEHISNLLN